MTGKHLTKKNFVEMPWKNGRGMTTELFRVERGGRMIFRVSSAAVRESGPFSDFAGFDRTLVNLGPGIMSLSHDDKARYSLSVNAVTHFDGGSKTDCQIDGATRDLNVFCAEGEMFATTVVRDLKATEVLPVPPTSSIFIYVISGTLSVNDGDGAGVLVNAGEGFAREADAAAPQARLSLAPAKHSNTIFAAIIFHSVRS